MQPGVRATVSKKTRCPGGYCCEAKDTRSPGEEDGQGSWNPERQRRCYPGPCDMNRNCVVSVCWFVLMLAFPWALFLLRCRQEGSHWIMWPFHQARILCHWLKVTAQASVFCPSQNGMVNHKSLLSSLGGELNPGFLSFYFFFGLGSSCNGSREVNPGYGVQGQLVFWLILHFASTFVNMYKWDLILVIVYSFSDLHRKGLTRKHFISMKS